MDKYQQLFLEKLKTTISQWEKQTGLSNQELYRLLHSIRGTASTIGLHDLTKIAEDLLENIDEGLHNTWKKERWKILLSPLLNYMEEKMLSVAKTMDFEPNGERKTPHQVLLFIVEEITTLTFWKKKFEQQGWIVLAAVNYEKAHSILLHQKPHLVVYDFTILKDNEQKQLHEMMSKTHSLHIPFVIINGDESSSVRMKAYKMGAADYLPPNTNVEEVLIRIENKLSFMDQLPSMSQNQYLLMKHKTPSGQFEIKSSAINQKKMLYIAIIDDDLVIQQILQDYFKRFSYAGYSIDIQTFREGESFFSDDWYKQEGNFIILLDGIMPRMDGYEVLKRIRRETPAKNYMIIMLTGRKNEKDIVKALELGADDYITKPFNLREIEARVRRLALRMISMSE